MCERHRLCADGTKIWSLMQLERQLRQRHTAGGEAATSTVDGFDPPTHRQHDLAVSRNPFNPALPPLDEETSPCMLMGDLAWWLPKGGRMPATTPEQIHRLFEAAFNAGDLDGLMELYEPDAALIAQPGSVAHGSEPARAAPQGFLALKGRITLDTKLVFTVGELAYLSNSWSLRGTGPDGNPVVVLGATTAEVARRQADGSWRYVIDNAWGDQAVAGDQRAE
jgi:ketosteroid isomerase-like protein